MRSRARGTTLSELLVVMAIMGVLMVLAQRVVVFGYEFYRTTDESITLQKEGLLALTWIGQDIQVSHHISIDAIPDPSVDMTTPPYDYREDQVSVPLPRKVDGEAVVNTKGALTWQSIAGYELDTTKHYLMRYLADTANDPLNQFLTGNPAPDDYLENIEFVTSMPSVATIKAMPNVNTRVVARSIVAFTVDKNVDTVDLELTILLPGRIRGGNALDNSLSLKTTVFPRN